MSLASSMKALVDNINTSTDERSAFIQDLIKDVVAIKKDTHALMSRFKKERDDLIAELKADAKELHEFLASSEKTREEDFDALMEEIKSRLSDITKWQKDVRKDAQELLKDARELIKEYASDIKQARVHWLSLSSGIKKKGKRATTATPKTHHKKEDED